MASTRPHQEALRRGRASMPGATYFLTICARRPCEGLAVAEVCDALLQRWTALAEMKVCQLLAIQVMPDHIHVLCRLGLTAELGDVVRSFKGPLTPLLRQHGLRWQPGGYFDHRVRDSDELGPILRYMLTNPYRKGLVRWDTVWPFWYCAPEILAWFEPSTNAGLPHREWLIEESPGSL